MAKRIKKKKSLHINILKKSLYSVAILSLISIFYFLVLISVEPKSFPFVTKKVESYINESLPHGDKIKISKISIDLDHLYKINVILEDVKLKIANEALFFKTISAKFSLADIALNQRPSAIKFKDAKIEISNQTIAMTNTLSTATKKTSPNTIYEKTWNVFKLLKNNDIITKEFEIEDVEFMFTDAKKNILIKSAAINVANGDDFLVTGKTVFNFNQNNVNVELNTNCQFNEFKYLRCDAGLFNLIPKELSNTFKPLNFLSNIDTRISADFNFEINKEYNLSNFLFNANASKGSFYYKNFFEDKMEFDNLFITGELLSDKNIEISELKVAFNEDVNFLMSMKINDFGNNDLENTDMYFKISNPAGNDIAKYWPIFLGPKIRSWVKDHIDQGVVKDAFANVKMTKFGGKNILNHIDSQILFSKLRVKYLDNMPEVYDIDGIASFTKDSMTIDLVSANVLDTKIKAGKVSIDNFHRKKGIVLNISGSATGDAEDLLKHVDYKGDFSRDIDKYINGDSDSIFNINIPIKKVITLNDIYLKVLANVKDINAEYFKDDSALNISVIKDFDDDNFHSYLDLTNAKIDFPIANLKKEKLVKSSANLYINATSNKLDVRNIDLIIDKSKIMADLTFGINPFSLKKAIVQNNYVDRYNFYYEHNLNKKLKTIDIKGDSFDLRSMINNSFANLTSNSKEKVDKFNVDIALKKLTLNNGESINNLNINLDCDLSLCVNSFVKGKIGDKHHINIDIFQKSRGHDYTTIQGNISDISLLARGFDISDQIIDGNLNIKAQMLLGEGNINMIKGKLSIDDGFSVIKNEIFEKIANDKNFDTIKGRIKRSDKISFDKLDLNFRFQDSILKIEQLIASSYLIGFTSKGEVNVSTNSMNLKGLIVPGYSLNKLFGIGDIPVLGAIIMGEKGGGLFAVRYDYKKQPYKKGKFNINAASSIVPGPIRNIFGLFD